MVFKKKLINLDVFNLTRITNIFIIAVVLLNLFNLSECLYEDQIGKFDWKQNYIGKLKFAYFDVSSNERIIAATEENVLTALYAKTGDILWRQVFERGPRGDIKFLHVNTDPKCVASPQSSAIATDVITVSGTNPSIVRSWNANTGNLVSEWFLTPNSPERAENGFWFHSENYLHHVIPVWGSHLEVTGYHPFTGQQRKTTSSKLLASWITPENCVLAKPFYACLVGNQLLAVDLTTEYNAELFSRPLNDGVTGPIRSIPGLEAAVILGNQIISLRKHAIATKVREPATVYNDRFINSNQNILLQAIVSESLIKVSATHLESGEVFSEINTETEYPETMGAPTIYAVKCRTKPDSQPLACRILLSSTDGAIVLLQAGKIKWTREESLANIATVEMIDLPLSDAEGAIEQELNSKDGDIYGAFFRRISGQIIHVKNLFLHVMGLGPPPSATQKAGLVRDAFGLHKIILIVTTSGKIFGIDNISGRHHWVKYLPEFTAFNSEQDMKLIVQRTSKHFPHPPQCAIIGRHRVTGKGVVYQFNPVSGQPVNGGVLHLDFIIQQLSLLHETGPEFLGGLLFLDDQNQAHVVPESATKYADKFYMFSANKNTGILTGYTIEHKNNKLETTLMWQVGLGGDSNSQKIVAVALKNSIEHVHSQGRVLGDRSVLYKYINPNLVAVATHGPDSIHKYVLNIHLIDIVSGAIVSSLTHRRVKGPFQLIHSENWLVYSYFNEKVRRTEITSIELYEGKTQTNSTVWSSMEAPPLPMMERQAYIFPSNIATLKETITEKGITNKHVLIGLSAGGIIEMPWALLDPRRPVTTPNQAREEGVIPYIPELPIPQENIINYNQSISNIKSIYTAPSGLESTCLVFAYGLDIFVTRVAPSKTFDLLKEDFDYFLITVVLIALTTASYVVKHLSSRKALKQAWK